MKKLTLFFLVSTLFANLINAQNEIKTEVYENDTLNLIELTKKWNDLIVNHELDLLNGMYAEQVIYYSVEATKEAVISKKKAFIEKYSDFNQVLSNEIDIFKINENKYRIVFPKTTTYNKNTYNVYGVLYFEKIADNWMIISESDNYTNGAYGDRSVEFSNCDEVIIEIVSTSPYFNKIADKLNKDEVYGLMIIAGPNYKEGEAFNFSEKYVLF
ncbi:MAG TPA: hypothetical protein PKG96_10360, partial [Bacilli bacterium]|nr:hypothetical protein [Bacilli bacterium]